MRETIKIRAYENTDKEALITILTANVPQYFAEAEIVDFRNYLASEIELYYIAEINGKVVAGGGINFAENNTIGYISWDFVDQEKQGRGIGSLLLKHRLHILQSIPSIQRISVRTSQLAYGFYQSHGFSLTEVKQNYWAQGFDLYKMEYDMKYISKYAVNSVFYRINDI